MASDAITIAAFAGSLRRGSYNKYLLAAAGKLTPEQMQIQTMDISDLPLYNEDDDAEEPLAPVRRLRDTIRAADGLLIVTPEYNFSMSGATKNVIDWASRPADASCLDGKPLALMGASSGGFGTVRAQLHLRDCAFYNNMYALNDPLVHVSLAQKKFNAAGELTDEKTKDQVARLLKAFFDWTLRMRR